MSSVTVITSEPFSAKLSELRDRSLTPRQVRNVVGQMSTLIAKDAMMAHTANEQVAIIVVLRAGLSMMDSFVDALPEDVQSVVYHLGLFRERETLQPVEYYNKLAPKNPKLKQGYVLDPVLATGGTAEATINILKDWGLDTITFVSLLASDVGLSRVTQTWPEGTRFVVGAVDTELDDNGYIKPGVGDIGDRLYGTSLD